MSRRHCIWIIAIGLIGVLVFAMFQTRQKTIQALDQLPWWTSQRAPDFTPTCGDDRPSAIPEVNGAGLALIDVDGDGVLEILVANGSTLDDPTGGPGCRIFQRRQDEWADITDDVGLHVHGWSTSATPLDVDGDGDSDVYITRIGPDVLLRNDAGTFVDISTEAGIDSPAWGTCAAAGDVNGDGWTDLYVANYVHWNFASPLPRDVPFMGVDVLAGPRGLTPASNVLYLNNGNGSFRDATADSGLAESAPRYSLNAVITDFDGDGQQDVLVGNDTMPNTLLTHAESQDESLQLNDTAARRGLATNADGGAQATMGLAIGDINADGKPDVFSTNFSSDTNTLHASTPEGWFADRTQAFGLGLPSRPFLGWTAILFDANLDGIEDLTIFNGHVYPDADLGTMDSYYAQEVLLMRGDGPRFTRHTDPPTMDPWAGVARVHRCGVLGVLDPTHGVELVAAPRGDPLEVVKHTGTGPKRRITIQLLDDRLGIGNREGHGAHLTIEHAGVTQHRWLTTTSPFQGASAAQVHVSVDRDAGLPLEITVDWPDGGTTHHNVGARTDDDPTIELKRSEATPTSKSNPPLGPNPPVDPIS